ncbi:MAG: 1-deoxy-D-xylulose-5-phosphate synthase [Candidatus Omnitrophica bacterium CG11_big_fil_rev_8_21_14_0_20_42_13]|uniref:1-deoxy-D-xylulose-5-phosphate synthase n=1 Tax=Candidatus Ghiorseimicrobium undicola TaxID=1974746 RepID=A0A2H0LX37_9BACT|nr:MAG: 1-deoxy-D-xylulose-5-phosphate synthase [Candidatus Omnitrophica bacterium CG11_big_fil_rev_8_21_14_0_20_42_13]
MKLIETVDSPKDLKRIAVPRLPILCQEIRDLILDTVSKTGGHLASSLGAVELAVALHYCLNTPEDILIWDVGHQAYAHKILTGRREKFHTLRKAGGLSGFPSKEESAYDRFTTGHASTSLSLALGMSCARDLAEAASKKKIAVVVGDGSLTGGMCFEALNNAGHLQKDLLVVFNTNEMSISPSVGALSNYLNKIISLPVYNRFREAMQDFIAKRVPKGRRILNLARKFEEGLKNILVPGIFFEELGFRYIGPLDGHNIELLVSTLKHLLSFRGPTLLHVVTKKGKGYKPAEESPENFHSVGKFNLGTGESLITKNTTSYTDVFGKKLADLAAKNNKIIAITAAMPVGTGLDKFASAYPGRFFDVGIAEEHAVGFAAGLAESGMRPVVAIYSTFLQRSFDQIMHDVCLQGLGVVFAIDRAGIVGEDGATHQGIFDIAYLSVMPNLAIMVPKDADELSGMLEFAAVYDKGPIAIRYPKGEIPNYKIQIPDSAISLGRAELLRSGNDVAVIALGAMAYPAYEAAQDLAKEGIEAEVVNARFVKPLDEKLLEDLAKRFSKIITIEEGILEGGFGSRISHVLNRIANIKQMGLPCDFIKHGKRADILAKYGLDKEGIIKAVRALCLK